MENRVGFMIKKTKKVRNAQNLFIKLNLITMSSVFGEMYNFVNKRKGR